jgi:hypothetical protein
MAMKAELFRHDEFVAINLYPDERRLKVEDEPSLPDYDPGWRIWFYWDDEKLDHGEHEFLGVEVPNIDRLEEQDFVALERLNPPRIDLPEERLFGVTVADALRWVKQSRANRQSRISA